MLGLTEAQVIARTGEPLEAAAAERFRALLERRLTGEPIAYILGEREFYGRAFEVDPRVLIPRPETEHLIEAALELELPERPRILDVGTGSGCVAITLALELPGSTVVGTDRSPAALAVAARNRTRHGVADRVHLLAADLTGPLELGRLDLVVGNPPYVDPAERQKLSPEVARFEPGPAVFAPGTGDSILERLTGELEGLRSATPIVLEIGHDQGERIRQLAADCGLTFRELRHDLAGHARIAVLSAP